MRRWGLVVRVEPPELHEDRGKYIEQARRGSCRRAMILRVFLPRNFGAVVQTLSAVHFKRG